MLHGTKRKEICQKEILLMMHLDGLRLYEKAYQGHREPT